MVVIPALIEMWNFRDLAANCAKYESALKGPLLPCGLSSVKIS